MTTPNDLDGDARKLERSFFAGDNAPLLAELRRKSEALQGLERLRGAVKLEDERFLERLSALGVRPETAVAVTVIPLIAVAWSDGELDDRERTAILDVLRDRGMAAEEIGGRLLRNGLSKPPDPRLFAAWKTYVGRLWGCFTADERWEMRTNLLQSARKVAEASGGFLGVTSKVSAAERGILAEIEAILD